MSRTLHRLSPFAVKNAGPGLHGDGGNLYLQVAPGGSKSWSLRFMLNGKSREMGLGPLHTITLAEARHKALEARKLLLDGVDPIEVRANRRKKASLEAAKATSFEVASDAYIGSHQASWTNLKHAQQWRSTLSMYAFPSLGKLAVNEIDLALVTKVLEPIWLTKPETASRLRGRIEAVLDYASTKGWRSGENPARWRGHLENLFPAKSKISRVKHHGALPWRDLPTFMKTLGRQEGVAAEALAFTILTAVRTGDVIGAVWREVDLDAATWVVPAHRVKGRLRDHKIPLADAALKILASQTSPSGPERRLDDHVFSGARVEKGLSNMALLALLRRMKLDGVTTHGFRSTFRDWAAEETDYAPEVIEASLAHTVSNKVEAAYKRTDFFEKRRSLMLDWSNYCFSKMTEPEHS